MAPQAARMLSPPKLAQYVLVMLLVMLWSIIGVTSHLSRVLSVTACGCEKLHFLKTVKFGG